jgi:hypothetical protein
MYFLNQEILLKLISSKTRKGSKQTTKMPHIGVASTHKKTPEKHQNKTMKPQQIEKTSKRQQL